MLIHTPAYFTSLYFRKWILRFRAKQDITLATNWYIQLRSCLGAAIVQTHCPQKAHQTHQICRQCNCLYAAFFKPEPTSFTNSENELKSHNIPPPFTITALNVTQAFVAKQQYLEVELTIVGNQQHWLNDIYNACQQLHTIGFLKNKFQQAAIYYLSPDDFKMHLMQSAESCITQNAIFNYQHIQAFVPKTNRQFLELQFSTPLTLKVNNILQQDFDFNLLISKTITRLFMLAKYYCNYVHVHQSNDSITNKGSIYLNLMDITNVELPNKQKKFSADGMLGTLLVRIENNYTIALALTWAQFLHTGTNTAFGNGKFSLKYADIHWYNKIISINNLNKAAEYVDGENKRLTPQILEQLKQHQYQPQAYRQSFIPKNDGNFRELNIPDTIDKIIQQAFRQIIEPELEKIFLPQSYAYRSNKGAVKTIRQLQHLIKNQKTTNAVVLHFDIDNFFDEIPIVKITQKIYTHFKDAAIARLVYLWFKTGICSTKQHYVENEEGIPQGNVISPLLSNFYLHDLDVYLHKKVNKNFVRYADNILVVLPDADKAIQLLQSVKAFLKIKLQLNINANYSIQPTNDPFEFLGLIINQEKIDVSLQKIKSILQKCSLFFKIENDKWHPKFFETINGIKRYYMPLLDQHAIYKVEQAIDNFYLENIAQVFKHQKIKQNKNVVKQLIEQLPSLCQDENTTAFYNKLFKAVYQKETAIKETQPTKKIPSANELLKRKKKEYDDLQEAAFDLIIDTNYVFVGISKKNITVYKDKKIIHKHSLLHLQHISVFAIGITFSTNLTKYCSENNIPIIFFDEHAKPYSMLYSMQNMDIQLAQAQLETIHTPIAQYIMKEIVCNKIRNQINLLKHLNKYQKQADSNFYKLSTEMLPKMEQHFQTAKLQNYEQDTVAYRNKLMLCEAHNAKIYWSLLSVLLQQHQIEFEYREHRNAQNIVNKMLNYGYAILYARVWQAVLVAGAQATISYLHVPQNDKPTLVFDLIEQYRTFIVDRAIISIITKGEKINEDNNGNLSLETRRRIIEKITERLNSEEVYLKQKRRVRVILFLQVEELKKLLLKQTKSCKFFIAKW